MRLPFVAFAVLLGLASIATPTTARAQSEQQTVVDRATLAAQDMLNDQTGTTAQGVLRRARAVMICPRVFKAGFLFAGQGGTCVLVARDGGGGWTSPAFYGLGGGSFGAQLGVADAEVLFIIMSDRGLTAVLDSQLKLGADASATFVDLGGGVEGATTTAFHADIVGFSRARGLFAGVSLGGSALTAKSSWNQAYYGRPVGVQQILFTAEASNPAADPLRTVLARYGSQTAPPPPPALPPPQPFAGSGIQANGPVSLAPPGGPIQRQSLPPPGRF